MDKALMERMERCLRKAASSDWVEPAADYILEARAIVALLPEPVDPDLIEAREIVLSEAVVRTANQVQAIREGRAGQEKVALALSGIKRGRELAASPSDDWIPWNGMKCQNPPPYGKIVQVKFRSGAQVMGPLLADHYNWAQCGLPVDIIAYRIAE